VKLLVQNSETIIPANDETWGEIKSRLSFYLSAYESKNTSQEMKTILAALMLYEGKQNKKQFQTVFNQLPVFGDSSLLTFELNNFVLRLEQILSEQFGISVQLDMKDPRFCEAMYALLCFLMTHKRNSEVNENMLEGDDLIGYQLERLQKNASLPLLISFAKKGVIYQYQLGPNFMPFLLA
jgi:hypothetical protein